MYAVCSNSANSQYHIVIKEILDSSSEYVLKTSCLKYPLRQRIKLGAGSRASVDSKRQRRKYAIIPSSPVPESNRLHEKAPARTPPTARRHGPIRPPARGDGPAGRGQRPAANKAPQSPRPQTPQASDQSGRRATSKVIAATCSPSNSQRFNRRAVMSRNFHKFWLKVAHRCRIVRARLLFGNDGRNAGARPPDARYLELAGRRRDDL